MHWRRKWQPTPVFLPGESQGWWSLVGCCLWVLTELDITEVTYQQQATLVAQMVKNLPVMPERPGFNPWAEKIPWRRVWQPTAVFLPGEFHGQRSLEGYSPWVRKELDTIDQLNTVQAVIEDGLPWWLSGKESTC